MDIASKNITKGLPVHIENSWDYFPRTFPHKKLPAKPDVRFLKIYSWQQFHNTKSWYNSNTRNHVI